MIFEQASFLPKEPHLRRDNHCEQDDNDSKGSSSTWLLIQIVLVKPLDRDEAERVVLQASNPASTKPQNRLFDLGCKTTDGATDTHLVVHDPRNEHGGGGGSSAMPTVQKMPVKTGKKNKAAELVKRDNTPVKTVETANNSHRESLDEHVTSGAKRKDKGKLVRPIRPWTAYNHGRIDNLFVSNRSRVQDMVALAIGPASEWKSTAVKGTTLAAVQTAYIPCAEICNSAPDCLRRTPSFDLAGDGVPALNKGKSNDPDGEIKEDEPNAVFQLG
ncbi:hypothetical protein HG530_002871 [Fusarium avenaceum]|nr:hypothetical protein HG530_002871 [Fusarium avenaceum]